MAYLMCLVHAEVVPRSGVCEARPSSVGRSRRPSSFTDGLLLSFYWVSLAFTETRFTERRIFFLSRTSCYSR